MQTNYYKMKNLLFLSAGRRVKLLKNAKESFGNSAIILATDMNPTAPALYAADKSFIVPSINDSSYLSRILDICDANNVGAVTTLIDPEIEILANNRQLFEGRGILILAPEKNTAKLSFNKYEMYKYLKDNGIPTPLTFHSLEDFYTALEKKDIFFPVFMKPICGSGSVGAHKVYTSEQLEKDFSSGEHDYIIQELMIGGDCDADVYIDTISHKAVSAFSKRKIETTIGGANKTVSFKDEKLFTFIRDICDVLSFSGPVDMDFFIKNGEYYLSEVNPRFGGAYLHAYGAGVDFFKLIKNNIMGKENTPHFGDYDEGVVMMMYDDVVICKANEMIDTNYIFL